ncbi:MAG TPA: hypothetical protein VNZ26_15590 [Vicinamibacterales bacterium]|jgi:hypothetical protein|nr:hypothetical protein [Vicinamibacterales bacterium]
MIRHVGLPGIGWMVVDALLIAGIVVGILMLRSRLHGRYFDLGVVSDHWIHAHRTEARDHYRSHVAR